MGSARSFFTAGWPTRAAFYLGKVLPTWGGHAVAATVARLIVALRLDITYFTYDNQRHVLGPQATPKEIKRNVYRVFFNSGKAYYELFHNVGRGRTKAEKFRPPVRLTEVGRRYIREALATGRGVCFFAPHMSNFDMAGIALAQGLPVPLQALSYADPPPGYELFNDLRRKAGLLITPIGTASLREAIGRLKAGGAIITGVERPLGDGDAPVEFFGDTAYLPTGYIRLPLRTDSLIITLASVFEEGEYRILVNPPWEPIRTGDREEEERLNVARVLREMEAFIRLHPDQWLMFEPVWKPDIRLRWHMHPRKGRQPTR